MSRYVVHIPLEVTPLVGDFDGYSRKNGGIFEPIAGSERWRVVPGLLNAELVPFIQAFMDIYPSLVAGMDEDEKEFAEEEIGELREEAGKLGGETFDFGDWQGALAKWDGIFEEGVFPVYGIDDDEANYPTGADGTRLPYYSNVYISLYQTYYKHIEMDLFRHLCLYRFVKLATEELSPRFALARFIGA